MLLYLPIGLVCLFTSTFSQDIHQNVTPDDDSYYPTQPNFETFDFQLIKELSPNNKNVIISPISLKLVLVLLYEGSTGDTEREFENVLQFNSKESVRFNYSNILKSLQYPKSDDYNLDLATRIFLDATKSAQQKFSTIAKDSYDTEIQPTNFDDPKNASDVVNSWVKQVTHNKIKKITKPDDLTRSIMVVANAMFFKGTWKLPFLRNETYAGNFFVNPKETVVVQYMTTVGEFYIHEHSNLDAKFLRLPYKGRRFSLWIVLPNSKGGLPDLIKHISLADVIQSMYNVDRRTVQVILPKFKFSFKENYMEFLKKFGLKQMFQNTASFPGIARGGSNVARQIQVSDIIQKSGIDLDEEGSVIYSATGVNIGNKFGEIQMSFNASRPFMFYLIEEPSNTIVFIGKVENPVQTKDRFSQTDNGISNEASLAQIPVNRPLNGPQLSPAVFPPQNSNYPVFLQPQSISSIQRPVNEQSFSGFDFQLLREFSKSNENVLISPLSIKTTLAMVLEGAKGECAKEIQMALRIGGGEQTTARNYLTNLLSDLKRTQYLEIANSIFVSKKTRILDSYRNVLQAYKGQIENVDFSNVQQAVKRINDWVSEVTRGLIPTIISPENIYKDSVVVIANALFFKGKWKTPFDEQNTKFDHFYTANGPQNVPMMQVTNNFNYNYIDELRAEALDLPYEDGFSMLIVMPSDSTNVENLAADMHGLSGILDKLNSTELNLSMPKFELEYSRDLIDVLKPMGVRTIFTPEANLTGIVANDNVQVNRIMHKTKIEVDEKGTKAAAATGVFVIPLIGSTAHKVTINRPFIYFIYHTDTKSIIFEGIFRQPEVAYQRPPQTMFAMRKAF